MTGRLIAIGDIHGCSKAFCSLISAFDPRSEDTVVTLGDYVDRGPDAKGVLDRLISLRECCQLIPLLGNHEEMMLDVLGGSAPYGWLQFGGSQTLDSYGFSGDLGCIPKSHINFLQECLDVWESDSYFFTHGNFLSDRPLNRQTSKILRWTNLREMVPGPHISGKIAIVGHTANKTGEILDLGHLKCIDTYCYGGKWLTGIDLTEGEIIQVNKEGNRRTENNVSTGKKR